MIGLRQALIGSEVRFTNGSSCGRIPSTKRGILWDLHWEDGRLVAAVGFDADDNPKHECFIVVTSVTELTITPKPQ